MTLLLYFIIFFLGLSFGSFLNVLLFRLDRKGGIMTGRSECMACLGQLKWYDLVPLASFLILRGKCRYCKSVISYIYPLTELVTAIVITVYFWANGFNFGPLEIFSIFVLVLMVALIFFDALYLILPDKIVFILGSGILIYNILFRKIDLVNLLLSGFMFGLAFAIIYLGSRGKWMGFGDVKLVAVIGLMMGYPLSLLIVIFSIWTAAIFGILLIVLNRASLKTALPFGSFLSAVTIIFIIFQNVIQKKSEIVLQLFY